MPGAQRDALGGPAADADGPEEGLGGPDDVRSARASVVVAAFTALSRASGLVRVLAVGAVLGPTHLGNAYQVSNTLPNLVWYGFLAGSLVASILVPVLVRRLDRQEAFRVDAVGGGFLGLVCVGALLLSPLAVLGLPVLLEVATLGVPADVSSEQVDLARLLVLLTIPQVVLYAVVGTSGAVMNSRRQFGLAAAGPAVENLGVIAVLGATMLAFGPTEGSSTAPVGEVLLLGAGSTAAVAVNAGQWWGARRCGVTLVPRAGWRDPEPCSSSVALGSPSPRPGCWPRRCSSSC